MSQLLETFEDPNVPLEELEPAERRIKDATSAFSLHTQIDKDNWKRDERRSRVIKLNGGAKPIPEKIRKDRGETWRSNFNSRTHESKMNELSSIYYRLLDSVPVMAKFTCDHEDDIDQNHRYGVRVSEAFHRFLREFWSSFTTQMELLINEMILFGVAPAFFTDDTSFKFESIPANTFLLPNGSSTDPDRWFLIETLYSYEVHELWALIRNEEQGQASSDIGWNADILREAIMASCRDANEMDRYNEGDWSSFEKQILNNDVEFSTVRAKRVHVVNQFVKEFDGKIRHLIIFKNKNLGDFMFDKLTDHKKFTEFFEPFYFDAKSEFHSIRGQGEKIYDHVVQLEIAKNDVIDSSRLGGSLIFKGRKGTEDRKNKWQKLMYLDESTEIINNPAENAAQGPLLASGMLQNDLNGLINIGTSSAEQASVQPLSAAEVTRDTFRNSVIQQSHINRWYRTLDHLYQTIWTRLISDNYEKSTPGFDERKMFFDLIDELEVPREALEDCTLLAFRASGQGSIQQFDLATRELLALGSEMKSDEKRQEALHLRTAAIFDYATAENYFPLGDGNLDSQSENTLIGLEINDIREGQFVPVQSDQRHTKHVVAVLTFLEQAKGEAQDINLLVQQFSVGLAHASAHMDHMANMTMFSEDLKKVKPAFLQLVEDFKQLQAQANQVNQQRQAEAQAQAEALEEQQRQQVDPEVLKVLKNAENERIDGDLKHEQNIKKEQDRHQERLLRVRADQQVDALEVAAKARND